MTRRFIFDLDHDDISFYGLLALRFSRVAEAKLDLEESTPAAVADEIEKMGKEESQKLMLKISELVAQGTTPKGESGFVIDFSLDI